jgi:hypothetical protein
MDLAMTAPRVNELCVVGLAVHPNYLAIFRGAANSKDWLSNQIKIGQKLCRWPRRVQLGGCYGHKAWFGVRFQERYLGCAFGMRRAHFLNL